MQTKTTWLPIVSAALFIVAACIANFFLLKDLPPDERGTLGDMFGVVNALFSGGALAGVIYAIILQRTEVQIARDELIRTKDMLRQQTDSIKRDEISRSFFSMLGQLNRTKSEIFVEVSSSRDGSRLSEIRYGERALQDIIIAQRQLLSRESTGLQFARERFEGFSRTLESTVSLIQMLSDEDREAYEGILESPLTFADKFIVLFSVYYFKVPNLLEFSCRRSLFRDITGLSDEEMRLFLSKQIPCKPVEA